MEPWNLFVISSWIAKPMKKETLQPAKQKKTLAVIVIQITFYLLVKTLSGNEPQSKLRFIRIGDMLALKINLNSPRQYFDNIRKGDFINAQS